MKVLGEAAAPARGQGGGAAEWDEGSAVDVEGRRGEACGGRTQAEAEAAMEGDGKLRRDAVIPEGKRGGGGMDELREDSPLLYIGQGKPLEHHKRAPTWL